MTRAGITRQFRALGAALFLVLFLAGTHLCLIRSVAVAVGARMPGACEETGKSPSAESRCGHCSPSPQAPAAPSESPCCIALLPNPTPTIAAPDDAPLPATLAPVLVLDAMHGLAVARQSTAPSGVPPDDPSRAQRAARAPPLA